MKDIKRDNQELNIRMIINASSFLNIHWLPNRIFLLTALFFGILMVFITPPFQAPDEDAHFLRAYAIAEGRFINQLSQSITDTGDMLPKSLLQTVEQSGSYRIRNHPDEKLHLRTIVSLFRIPLNPEDREFVTLYLASYPPIMFIPQAAGIWIGRIFRFPPIVLMYLGRLFNLGCWILLIAAALRLLPVFKWTILVLALMPMSVFISASLSADTLANAGAILFVALILHFMFSEKKLGKNEITMLFLAGGLTALCKQVYAPLLLLSFFIPVQKYKSKRSFVLISSMLVLTGIMVSFLWSQLLLHGYPFNLKTAEDLRIIRDARPEAKTQFIMTYPFFHIRSVLHTIIRDMPRYIRTFTGTLGWLDTPLPRVITYSYPVVLLTMAMTDHKQPTMINWKHKLGIILFVIIPVLLILFTAAAIAWNPPGSMYIKGIQGRYFIPIAPVLLLLFYNQKFKTSLDQLSFLIGSYTWLTLVITTLTLIYRYYS